MMVMVVVIMMVVWGCRHKNYPGKNTVFRQQIAREIIKMMILQTDACRQPTILTAY
jgi:hypothetical protein